MVISSYGKKAFSSEDRSGGRGYFNFPIEDGGNPALGGAKPFSSNWSRSKFDYRSKEPTSIPGSLSLLFSKSG